MENASSPGQTSPLNWPASVHHSNKLVELSCVCWTSLSRWTGPRLLISPSSVQLAQPIELDTLPVLLAVRVQCRASFLRPARDTTTGLTIFWNVLETSEAVHFGQFLAKLCRPQEVDEEVDAAAVDNAEFLVNDVS